MPYTSVAQILTAIASCLCAEVNADDDMCFCGVIQGEAAVHDFWPDCDNDGMAWVRLGPTYPSTALGQADETPGIKGKALGLDIDLGIVRSYEFDDTDLSISPEQYATMATRAADDMQAIYKVIACCDALEERDFIMGQYLPIGPSGGVYGGSVTVYTQV